MASNPYSYLVRIVSTIACGEVERQVEATQPLIYSNGYGVMLSS